MLYSSALVLCTLAVGQVAAGHAGRHASFHARRQADEVKRSPDLQDVNWSTVAYNLAGVDWSSVFNTQKATPAPAATPAPVVSAAAEAVTSAAAPPPASKAPASKAAPVETPKPSAAKPAASSQAPASSQAASPLDTLKNDITNGVQSLVSKLGLHSMPLNAQKANGVAWLNDNSSPFKANMKNSYSSTIYVACWQNAGYTGFSLNAVQAPILISLAPGASETVYFAKGFSGACGAFYPDTKLAFSGGVNNSWLEMTLPGGFDVSREYNMQGHPITAVGSKCTSSFTSCVFECTDKSVQSCETGYDLFFKDVPGCSGGYDAKAGGTGGSCATGSDAEELNVSFS